MITREELHRLVDSLPDTVLETAQQMLTRIQVPSRPTMPPELERFREEVKRRRKEALEGKRGIFGMTTGGRFDPSRGSGSMGSTYWEDETMIIETLRLHKGYEIVITERIRLEEAKRLIYACSVRGPGNKTDEHESTFDISI